MPKTDAKYPIFLHQLCLAEIVLILNAAESTFLGETMSRVFQTVQGAHLFQTRQEEATQIICLFGLNICYLKSFFFMHMNEGLDGGLVFTIH